MSVIRTAFYVLFVCVAINNLCANVLVYSSTMNGNIHTFGADSLDWLGVSYTVAQQSNFDDLLTGSEWSLVILDMPSTTPSEGFGSLIEYIEGGGKAIMSYWGLQLDPALAAAFEVESVSSFESPSDVHPWDLAHPIFNSPNPGIGSLTSWTDWWFDDGDRLNPVGSAVALAGFTTTSQSGQAAIVLGNNGRTLYNGFLWDSLDGATGIPLIANQISFLLNGEEEAIPEPATLFLLGPALLALGWAHARRGRTKAAN